MSKRAVVLLSGGLDSATVLAIAKDEGFESYALSFAYGQRHEIELRAASRVVMSLAAKEHRTIKIDLRAFGGSALTAAMPVPKNRAENEMTSEIPITYVPARNTIFLSYALAWAEVLDARDVFIGVNALDYSGYPDCRPEFIDAFARVANLGTKAGASARPFRLHAPLIAMSKSEIVRRGQELGVPFDLTHSCYDPLDDGRACGECDSCQLRRKGFHEAGILDPASYAPLSEAAERTSRHR